VVQRKSGHVTLLDVARACGSLWSTVSIVLSEARFAERGSRHAPAGPGHGTAAWIHPDAFAVPCAAALAAIGVLAYDLSDPYCIPIVRGFRRVCSRPAISLVMDAQTQRGLSTTTCR